MIQQAPDGTGDLGRIALGGRIQEAGRYHARDLPGGYL